MRGLLLDQNIPSRLAFTPGWPVTAATDLGISPSDRELWEHARDNELVIVTKDADFSDRAIVHEPPPWVVHLRFGNLHRRDFHARLAQTWPLVASLLPAHKLITVFADRIEAVR